MEYVYAVLGPQFLVSRIDLIALILGATLLVILSDFFNGNVIFPIAGYVKRTTHGHISKTKAHEKAPWFTKYFSEGVATFIFIVYCYLGASVLAEYVFSPIMFKLRNYILLIVIGLFFGISYLINNVEIRGRLLKV